MSKLIYILSITLSLIAQAIYAKPSETPLKGEVDWLYTLAFSEKTSHFGFSLMKDSQLTFSTWSDQSELSEKVIELSNQQHTELKADFDAIFKELSKENTKDLVPQNSYIFEQITPTTSRTIESSSYSKSLKLFVKHLVDSSKVTLPFKLPL